MTAAVNTGQATVSPTRRERTRQALLAAAERLLLDNFATVSVDDLIAEAGVAKGTFYNHFNDKSDLFQALVDFVRDDMRAAILRQVTQEDDPARKCVIGFCTAVRYMILQPQRRRIVVASQQSLLTNLGNVDEGIVRFIADGIASGRFQIPTVEAGVLVNFGLVQVCTGLEFERMDGFAAVSRVQQLGAALLRALGVAADQAEQLAAQGAELIIRPLFPRSEWRAEALSD